MIFTAWCACCAMSAAAQDCEISLTIAKAAQKEELPSQVQEILGNRLAASGECCQFQFYTILYHS